MVAIVTGNGLGLERSSAWVLGSAGQLGQAALGRAGDNVYVNAANGNLVVTSTDEMLFGLGPDSAIGLTHNSQATEDADNGDNWRISASRKIQNLTGTVNTSGSTITRVDWDGSEVVFTWDGSAYVSKEGSGAYDKITHQSGPNTWTWQDGDSRIQEVYEYHSGTGKYRIVSATDTEGKTLDFDYNGDGYVSRITTSSGTYDSGGTFTARTEYTDFTYSDAQLTSLVTSYRPNQDGTGTLQTLTRVHYTYNTEGRLWKVKVDLSPGDNSIATGGVYETTYTYHGDSDRVASISQTDGSYVQFTHEEVGGAYRVTSIVQTAASGVTRTTDLDYDTTNRITTITRDPGSANPTHRQTKLTYDTSGQLTKVEQPAAVTGAAAQIVYFTYDSHGNVTVVDAPGAARVDREYDTATGLLLRERDALGNTISRTYDTSTNALLTETRYLTPDPDASGASWGTNPPTGPETTRYIYDTDGDRQRLRFVVTPEERVTEYIYNYAGNVEQRIQYTRDTYDISTLGEPTLSTLEDWAGDITDKSQDSLTVYTYDHRGNLWTEKSYENRQTTGAVDTNADYTLFTYVYDQAGKLLSRLSNAGSQAETFTYDGLGRVTASVDFLGHDTTITYYDSSSTTTIEFEDETTRTSVFNLAGELITVTEAWSDATTTRSSSFKYDSLGRLRSSIDATGVETYALYDRVGRKVADIGSDGTVVEYKWDANDRLAATIRYKNKIGLDKVANLKDVNGDPTSYELGSTEVPRPTTDSTNDRWEWRIYDDASRLVEIIGADGSATKFVYDGSSRLVSTIAYANTLSVSGFKTTLPTTLQIPGTLSEDNDRASRNFYDKDSRLIGTLDADGFLTQIVYDAAGRTVETIRYAKVRTGDPSNWATDSFSTLLGAPGTDDADTHNYFVYDARGLLVAEIDGEGAVSRYVYDALGNLELETRGQKLSTEDFEELTSPLTLLDIPDAVSGTTLDVTAYTRNLAGQVLTATRTVDGGTEVTTYDYDDMRRVIAITTADGTADERTVSYRYDEWGRLSGILTGEGTANAGSVSGGYDQTLVGTSGANTLTGGSGADLIQGLAGGDTLSGAGGDDRIEAGDDNDSLDGGTGADTLIGGLGNDNFYVDNTGDVVVEASGEGADRVYSSISYTLAAAANVETLSTTNDSGTTAINLGGNALINSLIGNDGANALYGFGGNDTISAGAGGDWLIGGTGDDTLTGGAGVDLFVFATGDGSDTINDFTIGTDLIDLRGFSGTGYSVTQSGSHAIVSLSGWQVTLLNTTAANVTSASFILTGGGGGFDQTIVGSGTGQTHNGGSGADLIQGLGGGDTLNGLGGNDRLEGGDAADDIFGGDGDDVIVGGAGRDDMTGGSGVDWFVFVDGDTTTGEDEITDFQVGTDMLDFTGVTSTPTITQVFSDTVIQAGTGADLVKVRLTGVTASTVTSASFGTAPTGGGGGSQPDAPPAAATAAPDDRAPLETDPYAILGTTYAYDKADRLKYKSEAGSGDPAQTLYYYDAHGRLVYSIRGVTASGTLQGEVVEYAYNAFGQVADTIVHGARLDATTFGSLLTTQLASNASAVVNTTVAAAVAAIANSSVDSKTQFAYDVMGSVTTVTDPLNVTTRTYTYNSFRELLTTTTALSSGVTERTDLTYYRRGLVKTEIVDATGGGSLQLTTAFEYDAFGQVTKATDPLGKVRSMGYDRAGHVVKITDAMYAVTDTTNARNTTFEYDGRGNVVRMVDREGKETLYAYDEFNRNVTVTTPEGLVTTTEANAHGETISITDPGNRTTTYTYDKDGALKTAVNGLGTQLTNTYENGELVEVIDARGVKVTYTYDEAGRVLTRKQDDGGLNLTTTYEYDPKGQQVKVTDPLGVIANFEFDLAGRQTAVVVDPSGLALRTEFQFDQKGRQTRVIEAAGTSASRTVDYVYDKADRLKQVKVDPTGLNLTTTYSYDKNGNVIDTTDAAGKISRFIYDNENRLIYSVDAAGAVIKTDYDKEGRAVTVTAYADAFTSVQLGALPAAGTAIAVSHITASITPNSSTDRRSRNVYDGDGRLRFTTDSYNAPVEYVYDGSGNVISRIAYDGAIAPANWNYATVDAAVDAISAKRITRAVFDAGNRQVFGIDALGGVTAYEYDANGNVIRSTRHHTAYTTTGNPSQSTMSSWATTNAHANDRTTRAVYDKANRQVAGIDALGGVTVFTYDADGQVTKSVRMLTAYATTGNPSATEMATWIAANTNSADRVTRAYYDKAGRQTLSLDAAGGVSAFTYNAAGEAVKSIQYATLYTAGGEPTAADLTTWIASNGVAGDRTTRQLFDAGGRALYAVDAEAYVTAYTYDATGRVTDQVRYAATYTVTDSTTISQLATSLSGATAGTMSKTHFTYDAEGRVLTRVLAYTAAEETTTTYAYNAFGDVTSITDGLGWVSTRTFDLKGRLISSYTPFTASTGATTTYEYDRFDNQVKVTDPRGNAGFFYYDALDRLVLQVDPEKFATKTEYSIGGEPTQVTRYYTAIAGSVVVGTQPTITTHTKDAVTVIERDKLDRVTRVTDAEGHYEQYTLNGFGDRTTVRNKLGANTTNTYDKLGRLTQEVLPVASIRADGTTQASTVTNKFEYDAWGNLTKTIEAFGLTEVRTTTMVYDKRNLLTSKAGDAVTVTNQTTFATTASQVPTEYIAYDARGNVLETKDANGARKQYRYDLADRKVLELVETDSATGKGALKTFEYDANNNVHFEHAYAAEWTLATTPAGAITAPTGGDAHRTTEFSYDRNNRLTGTSVAAQRVGSYNTTTSAYVTTASTALTTAMVYDDMGNVVQQTDRAGVSTFAFYDKLGRRIAQVDGENYLTSYTLDGEGNVTKEERFATKISGSVTIASNPATLKSGVSSGGARTTDFTYDKNGRRLTETRQGVAVTGVNTSTGALTTTTTTAVITYVYNGLGGVTKKTEANGDYVDYTFDNLGRQTSDKTSSFTDYNDASVKRLNEVFYNGLGNVSRQVSRKDGDSTQANWRVTQYAYGAGGRLSSMTDAAGAVHDYGYDKAGRLVQDKYTRLKADGSTTLTEAVNYQYDAAGRVTVQNTVAYSSGAWQFTAANDYDKVRYNTFGEVTGRGVGDALWQETYDYDDAGRLWRTTAGDGSVRLMISDGLGRATMTFASAGTGDLSTYSTLDAAIDAFDNLGALGGYALNNIGGVSTADFVMTIDVHDKRGQKTATREPFRELTAAGGSTTTIIRSRTYNAYGEVASETDARGYTTDFTYNTMGRLVEKKNPFVNFTEEDGEIVTDTNQRATEKYYYDASGRMVAVENALGHKTSRLLAHTALGSGALGAGGEPIVLKEFNPDGGVRQIGVDHFGDQREITDQLGEVETRAYDKMGRLITLVRPTRTSTSTTLTENYEYDSLGQRVRHWNSFLGSSTKEKTDYDLKGRVVSYTDYGGFSTTYAYSWSASTETTGLGTFGAWSKTTTNSSALTLTEKTDYFGRTVDKQDFATLDYSYAFNKAGWQTGQDNAAGQNIDYTYLNTGRLRSVNDWSTSLLIEFTTQNVQASYTYDAEGNRLTEYYEGTYRWQYYDAETHQYMWETETRVHQDATVTWDAMNRMVGFNDAATISGGDIDIDYEYDKAGNVRHMVSTYGGSNTVQDYWYKYDNMGRFVTTKGTLDGARGSGSIVRGTTGTDLTYNAGGQRTTATTGSTGAAHLEQYFYGDDGYLELTKMGDNGATPVQRAVTVRDAMGRLIDYTEYKADGSSVMYSRDLTYSSTTQNLDTEVVFVDKDGSGTRTTTNTYKYNKETSHGSGVFTGAYMGGAVTYMRSDVSDGPETQTRYSYGWGDSQRQSIVYFKPNENNSLEYNTQYEYNLNGKLLMAYVNDGAPTKTAYATDVSGQILWRGKLTTMGAVLKQHFYVYFNGMRVGDTGNDTPGEIDYATTINERGDPNPPATVQSADFDQSYTAIGPQHAGSASSWTVRDGDTLQAIAAAVWGDASLWYLIADANGLSGSDSLIAGQMLAIPAAVANVHNTSDTFRPYDPNKAIGDNMPVKPKPVPDKRCSSAAVLVAIIAVAVTTALFGPLGTFFSQTVGLGAFAGAVAAGAVAGAAGSAVSQGVGMAIGYQDKFDWKAVGMAAVSGAVGAGLGQMDVFRATGNFGADFIRDFARGAIGSALTQGIGVATGLQKQFDWVDVAVSGVGAAVGGALTRKMNSMLDARLNSGLPKDAAFKAKIGGNVELARAANGAVAGFVGGVVGAGARSLIEGSSFGDNLMSSLPSMIGNTIGGMIADGIRETARIEARDRLRSDALAASGLTANPIDGRATWEFAGNLAEQPGITQPMMVAILLNPEIRAALADGDLARAGRTDAEVEALALAYFESNNEIWSEIETGEMDRALRDILPDENGVYRSDPVQSEGNSISSTEVIEIEIDEGVHPGPGEKIFSQLFTSGGHFLNGIAELEADYPGAAGFAYGAGKTIFTGGPVKAVVLQVAKIGGKNFLDGAMQKVANSASTATERNLIKWGERNGVSLNFEVNGQDVVIGAGTFAFIGGQVAGAVVEAMTFGDVGDAAQRGRNVASRAWKEKIHGRAQRTGSDDAHQYATYRQAIRLAKDPDVVRVDLDHGYNRALGLRPGTISPNRRPDVTATYRDGRVARVEVESATDTAANLRRRNADLDEQIRDQGLDPLPPVVVRPTRTPELPVKPSPKPKK